MKYILLSFSLCILASIVSSEDKLLVISVATEPTDGFKRFEASLKAFNYNYEILGMNEEWRGGDMERDPGGGQKVNIIKKGIEKYKDDEDLIVVFTDSYDVIASQDSSKVIEKFKNSGARIIFGAEPYCWPQNSLANDYPVVGEDEKRFLNSGLMMGYMKDFYEIVHLEEVGDTDDDQLYYTKLFLSTPTRNKYKMKLDTRSEIFQNLNGAIDEIIKIEDENKNLVVFNNLTKTYPAFIHGNGPSKLNLLTLGNYIGNMHSVDDCKICLSEKLQLVSNEENAWPNVTIGIFIESGTAFLREFFNKVSKLNYPKYKISLLIYNNVKYHNKVVEDFFVQPENEYLAIKYISPEDGHSESEARAEALEECIANKCDYYFTLTPIVHLDNPDALKILIEENRGVLSPIMRIPGKMWSNVWGAIDSNGYYRRSDDYFDLVDRTIQGIFNLPHVSQAVLIKGELLKDIEISADSNIDSDVLLAKVLRDKSIFMYGTNTHDFGHLIENSNFDTDLIRPEMFQIFDNYGDWIERYVHKEYKEYLQNASKALEPCTDVFWFPIVTDEFCEDLIEMMEDYGEWSGGRNSYDDNRLPGGKENVPTVDIHMKQIGWDTHWLYFLEKIVSPMQQAILPGYYQTPSALLSFVVRYKPGEQDHLKPHNDASTYTINIALNRPGIDFEGGGCRFVRRNCSVTQTRKGWAMIHPGRLTHFHEGLKTTKGTRYIMVTFVDP